MIHLIYWVTVLGMVGFGLPFLFSDRSYIMPIAGVIIILLLLYIGGKMYRKSIMKLLNLMLVLLVSITLFNCQKVPAGNVGVKVYLLGGDKGVDHEELGVGRYWIGINEDLYLFPTFTQNYVWTADETEGSPNDESITFQTTEGMGVNGDIGISYHINPSKVSNIFQNGMGYCPQLHYLEQSHSYLLSNLPQAALALVCWG